MTTEMEKFFKRETVLEEKLDAAGLGYPMSKEDAVKAYKTMLVFRTDTPEMLDCELCFGVGHDFDAGLPCVLCCEPAKPVIDLMQKHAELLAERNRLKVEREALRSQVATLQAEPNSYQSGYDEGRKSMASHADQWRKEANQANALKDLAGEARDAYAADKKRLAFELNDARAEAALIRKALEDCATSLEGEMLQKFAGQRPEDMHPVTRREYDRDMAELAGYRAAVEVNTEIIWCACGDGYPANSYGAGFMAANNDVCENCDAPNVVPCESGDLSTKEHGDSADLSTNSTDELAELRRDAERYRWLRSIATSQDIRYPLMGQPGEIDETIDAAMAKEQSHDQ